MPLALSNLMPLRDVFQLRPDIVIITELWLKSHHSDGLISIDGYSSLWKDMVRKEMVVY